MPAATRPVLGLADSLARGWALRNTSRPTEAARLCRQLLVRHSECGEAWHLLGLVCMDLGDHQQAVDHLQHAVDVEPHQPLHYNNLAVVLNEMNSHAAAAQCLHQALRLAPDYQDAKCNLGLSFYHMGRLTRAAACFSEIIDGNPGHAAALSNLGMTRLAQQNHGLAARSYEQAIALDPTQPEWHGNLGAAYMRLGRFDDAVHCYRQALTLDPQSVDLRVHLGIALRATGDLTGSILALESVLSVAPGHPQALAHLVVDLEYTCQWRKLKALYPALNQSTQDALANGRTPDEDPMLNIRRSWDPALNQAVARSWSGSIEKKALCVLPRFSHAPRQRDDERLTIGYLSYDFRNHPVAHQLYPLFSGHDRSRFRVIAFSMGPDDGSAYRRMIRSGSDEFIDISSLGLARAAKTIHERRPDILVDLMGHSHHNRMALLSARCAPLQVSYLGFLSTSGCDAIDYIVTDRIVVPREQSRYYSEKLISMPHCYQMNHSLMPQAGVARQREKWNLPANAFVFSCFNNAYKVDAALFEIWMEILAQAPNAVLWLYGVHPQAVEQMRLAAQGSGIDPQRLIFARKVPLPEHLERLRAADLALDTLRYNGGATTSNALSVGLPVLTVMGRHWVSRMSASHLMAAGMPDLIFDGPQEYAQAAISLTRDTNRLAQVRQRLAHNLKAGPLFDHQGFIRHLETGYELIWRRFRDGLEPCDIDIPELHEMNR